MKVTVITVNLNNLEGLRRTAESVMAQTSKDFEYIIMDGGSTDGSKEYIASLSRVDRWTSEPDRGIYHAMNKGVALARGEYCIFMNSGDAFCHRRVLESVIPYLAGGDFYVGRAIFMEGKKRKKTEYPPQAMSIGFLLQGSINHQATFTRVALLRECPYNERHRIISDWELFFREWLLRDRSYFPLPVTVAYYDMGGISSTKEAQVEEEREEVMGGLIPRNILDKLRAEQESSSLEWKVRRAMWKPPVRRDCKLLRNAFKFLLKDLARHLFRPRP